MYVRGKADVFVYIPKSNCVQLQNTRIGFIDILFPE